MRQGNSKRSDRLQNKGKENYSEMKLKSEAKIDTGNGKKGNSDIENYIIRKRKAYKK